MGKLTIIGNDKPVIGKQEMYSVSTINGWLNPLQPIKNPLQIPKAHWEVMVQTKTGWRKGGSDKEGQIVPYIFGQKSLFHKGIKIIVRQGEDYGELIVHPQRAKEPKITRVELLDANYKPIPKGKKLSYKDTIIARAYCVEMFGMNIAFTLWEDDAQGEGHNPTVNALNKINPVPVLSRVNEKGMAEAVFRLPFYTMAVLIANARTASGDKSEGPTHEYYVTADVVSKHIQKASPNVNVVNPTYNPEPPRQREPPKKQTPSPTKPKTTPVPEKPKPDSPKFPVTTGGKKSDDPQGKILSAEFVDNNGKRLHSSKVGTTVRIKIVAKEMKDKKVKVKIWEEDNFTWTNDMIFEKDCVLIGDNNYINNVQLTKQMFDKAKDGGSDSARQDYFIEVIHHDTSVTSEVMPVTIDAELTEVESGISATMVKEPKQEKKREDRGCPRCKILTKEEVDKIFTSASENNKKALLTAFNDGNLKFEINTCLRKAHFFAQVLEEVGTSLKLSEPESFNYSARRLKDGDYVKGTGWVKDLVNGGYYKSGTWKSSPFSYFKTHHREADLYGRKDLNKYNDNGIQAANSKEIANLVYADKNRTPKYRLGNTQDGDGWKFMGKGIIQVTGRANYTEVNNRLEKKGYNFDIVNNPDNVLKHKESVLSSMAFWYWKDLQLKSDKGGIEIVDSITKIVNEATSTYSERRENFDKTYSVFQVNKCSPVKKEEEPKSNGKWRMPIDNPMLCLYSQGGGEKPWHGSFGEKIRDNSENHAGVDLLAKPGLPVYACLKGVVERVYTSTSRAGRVVVVKVTDKETFKSLKRNYIPLYKNKGEILEKGFNPDGNIYLVFMHLSKFGKFQEGQSVNHNDIIGYTGVSGKSGNNFETRNPHLHFEVNNVGSAAGLNGKCNPMVYFKFKTESEMSTEDKKLQLEYKNKVWK